ncbi:MAG: DUF1801 domain-containing protein [Marinicaulis sp.]|nr:DUF1801 domain-containing protein [Marinicaulis sp.]
MAKAGDKTKPSSASVIAFINAVENETRKRDAKILLAMMKKITGEKPKMWGPTIIGFGQHHYQYESGREGDGLDVGFSPRKANMVLYVLGSLSNDDLLLGKLGKFKRGKSCLYINKLSDVDEKVLSKIVEKSYKLTKKKWGA